MNECCLIDYLRQGDCVFIDVNLFVYLLVRRIAQETTRVIFTNFVGKVAHGPRMKLLDFGGNLDYVSVKVGYCHTLHGSCPIVTVLRHQRP